MSAAPTPPPSEATLYVNDLKSLVTSMSDYPHPGPAGAEASSPAAASVTRRSPGRPRSTGASPARHGGGDGSGNPGPLSGTSRYPASASRRTPAVSPKRASTSTSAHRRSGAAPLSLRELNAPTLFSASSPGLPHPGASAVFAPLTAQKPPQQQRSQSYRHHLLLSPDGSPQLSSGGEVWSSGSGPGPAGTQHSRPRVAARAGAATAAATQSRLGLTAGVGGGVYAVKTTQHPLYAGRGPSRQPPQRRSPPPPSTSSAAPASVGAVDGGELAISAEANTARRIQPRGTATRQSAAAPPPPAAAAAAVGGETPLGGVAAAARPAARRGSVIEQLAAATRHEGGTAAETASAAMTLASSFLQARRSASRGAASGPRPWAGAGDGDGRALGALKPQDALRMRLQPAPSNVPTGVAGEVQADRRLPNDAIVLPGARRVREEDPETSTGMYANLKSFRMPGVVTFESFNATPASTPPPPPQPPGAAATAATPAAPLTSEVTAIFSPPPPGEGTTTAAPSAQVLLPPPPPTAAVPPPPAVASAAAATPGLPPPPPLAGTAAGTAAPAAPSPGALPPQPAAAGTDAAAGGAAPPPPPPASSSNAAAAAAPLAPPSVATEPGSAAPTTAPYAGPPTPRELTAAEKAEAEQDRLLRDLLSASQQSRRAQLASRTATSESRTALLLARHPNLNVFAPPTSATAAASASTTDLAAAVESAVLLRRSATGGALDGWWRPPANVLLPDPSQAAPVWALAKSASAQEAQQAAVVAVLARPPGGSPPRPTSRPVSPAAAEDKVKTGSRGAADGKDADTLEARTSSVAASMDYHAPFQCVLHPEHVEQRMLPAALGAGADADTGVDDAVGWRPPQAPAGATGGAATAAGASPASAAEASPDPPLRDAPESVSARDGPGRNTAKSLASQAVILSDPLSLLACEHLVQDTIDVTARRRAYLSAMDAMQGILRGGTTFSTTRPGSLESVLQVAAPPGEVFCELTYAAKVLLSAVLYMRALGALPSLLRVGPLTEYSPVVDKGNCIELVFYNPTEAEVGEAAAQEEQQLAEQRKRSRQSLSPARMTGSTVFYNEGATPMSRPSFFAAAAPASRTSRSRSQPQSDGHEGGGTATARERLRSHSASTFRGSPDESLDGGGRSGTAGGGGGGTGRGQTRRAGPLSDGTVTPTRAYLAAAEAGQETPSSQAAHEDQYPLQRRPSAIEARLMQTLSSTAMRRMSHDTHGTAPPSSAHPGARPSLSPTRSFSRASFTSLAGPPLPSTEASLVVDDALDDGLRTPAASSTRRLRRSESGGAWLLRGAPQDAGRQASTVAGPGGPRTEDATAPPAPPQRRGSEAGGGAGAVGQVPRVRIARPPVKVVTPAEASAAAAHAAAAPSPALRRSSVLVAMEDLQQQHRESMTPGTDPTATTTPTHVGNSARASRSGPPPPPRARFAKPATPFGHGDPRFMKGEQELCVVLRAVVAQKSHVYAFGKGETVHVLPPLPPRDADDTAADPKALLQKQAKEKAAELGRLAVNASDPLFKLLSGGSKLRGEAKLEAEQRRANLRERARRVAASSQRRGPVTVNEHGVPTADDYGDLVVAFVLSGTASQLSGSVPDMIELEALRYRIFSLLGYSVSDPAGMQAVKQAAASAGPLAGASAMSPRAPTAARAESVAMTASGRASGSTSSLDPSQARLQQQLAAFTAFQNPGAASTSASRGEPPSASRASITSIQRRPSFFESALRRTDPLADPGDPSQEGGHYATETDTQLRQRQQKSAQVHTVMRRRYPIYRASSVAESTLQNFFAESRAAVADAHRRREQRGAVSHTGAPTATSSNRGGRALPRDGPGAAARQSLHGLDVAAAATALQEAERDLLRFRPMNLNSFHRELTDAVQYALDLQIRQGKENVMQAFHM